jgi:quercetin dioxygenase-like cupin family protein
MKPIINYIKNIKKEDTNRGFSLVGFSNTEGIISNIITYSKDSLNDEHLHEDGFELVVLIKGKQDFFVGGKKYTLTEMGDRIFFPKGLAHSDKFYKDSTVLVVKNTVSKTIKKI